MIIHHQYHYSSIDSFVSFSSLFLFLPKVLKNREKEKKNDGLHSVPNNRTKCGSSPGKGDPMYRNCRHCIGRGEKRIRDPDYGSRIHRHIFAVTSSSQRIRTEGRRPRRHRQPPPNRRWNYPRKRKKSSETEPFRPPLLLRHDRRPGT